jgi:hypothetical protein
MQVLKELVVVVVVMMLMIVAVVVVMTVAVDLVVSSNISEECQHQLIVVIFQHIVHEP